MIKCPTCGIDRELYGGNCECNQLQPEWDEVREDEIRLFYGDLNKDLENIELWYLMEKYLYIALGSKSPVRIKCRKGKILIERIGGKK